MSLAIEEEELEAACTVAAEDQLPCGDAEVVYSGSNVLVHLLPSPVVARVTTGTVALHDDPRRWLSREVAVTDFLAPTGVAVAPSSMIASGPYRSGGLWMTFPSWAEVEGPMEAEDPELLDDVFDTALPTQAIHGDASLTNLPRTPVGLVWNDFEDALRGPVHWDLAGDVMALEDRGADAYFVGAG